MHMHEHDLKVLILKLGELIPPKSHCLPIYVYAHYDVPIIRRSQVSRGMIMPMK